MIKPRQINYEVNNETMVKPDIGYSFMEYITGHDEKKENGVIINVNWGSRQNIESGTWKQLCEKFFNEIKKEIGHNPISTILLTGGGSNMYFIKEICKDVFKDRNVNILLSDNPSFSVAYGLCYAAVSDLKFGEYVNAAVDGINPKIKNLNKDILKGLVKKIMEIAQDNISYWISPDSGIELGSQSTIEWLMNHVQTGGDVQMKDRTIKRLMGIEPDLKINDICEESIEGLKDHISSCIAKLVNNSIKSLYSDNISNEVLLTKDILDDVLDIKIPKIEASKVFKRIDYRGFWFWLFDADPEKEYTMERPLNNIFYGRKHVVKKYFEPNLQNLIERELTKENGVMSIIWESINKSIRSSIENAFNIAMLKDEN